MKKARKTEKKREEAKKKEGKRKEKKRERTEKEQISQPEQAQTLYTLSRKQIFHKKTQEKNKRKQSCMKRKLYRRLSLHPWPTHAWADKSGSVGKPKKVAGHFSGSSSEPAQTTSQSARLSAYGRSLRTRRQLCILYGGLRARTYRQLESQASKAESLQVERLFLSLEKRLATCLLRTNCFASFQHVRSLLRQGKIFMNGKKIYSPGYICQPGDILSFPTTGLSERLRKTNFLGRPGLHLEIDYALGQAIVLPEPACVELPANTLAAENS